jgi:trans-aconitate 2-methyltransferase
MSNAPYACLGSRTVSKVRRRAYPTGKGAARARSARRCCLCGGSRLRTGQFDSPAAESMAHCAVFPRLVNQLRVGGVLAVQMPNNFSQPSHRLMRELGEPWNRRLSEVRYESPVLTTQCYYDLLAPCSTRVDIWQTTYEHVMPDVASIVDWVKGTGIRPYLTVLSEREQAAYLQQYARAIDAAYPQRADGKRLFSFTRIFIVAVR